METGRLHYFINEWRKLISVPVILDTVEGCDLDIKVVDISHLFSGELEYIFNEKEKGIISKEINKLLELKVIELHRERRAKLFLPFS